MNKVDVEVNDMVPIEGVDFLVRGQITIEYYDPFNWKVCSIGLDIFEDEIRHNGSSIQIGTLWGKIVPTLSNQIEDRIQTAIMEK